MSALDNFLCAKRYFTAYLPFISDDVASFIASQIMLETAFLSSRICVENHNLFGMKHPKSRLTLSVGERYKHAYFSKYADSVADYVLWCQYNGFTQKHFADLDLFRSRLANSKFNPYDDYISRIDKIFNQYK